jgi:hypothetical protein
MRTRSALVRSLAIAAALLASGASPAAAARPTVVGKVTGKLPPSSRAATEIRAFDAGRAHLVARATVSRTGTFRLALPPGGYILATSITPEHGRKRAAVRRVIPLTLAAGQRRRAVKIAKPTAKSSAATSPVAGAAHSQESGAITPGRIAFTVETFAGATSDLGVMNSGLTELLQTDLTRTPCRSADVANSVDRVMIEQELDFQKSRYVDPSTRVTRNFIEPDIVVRGRLRTRGENLGYALTLVDRRTGTVLETLTGTLAGTELFAAEQRLAARLAKRLCAYGEVYEITFTGTGTANFATHSAIGTLSAEKITARPTQKDAQGPIRWEGSAPIGWTNVAVTSKTDCSYAAPVSGGTWTAMLARADARLEVQWLADKGSTGTATVVCPDGEGGEVRIPGQATTSLIGSEPAKFLLPATGMQRITGGFKDQGDGWDNALELRVRTVRVEPLG